MLRNNYKSKKSPLNRVFLFLSTYWRELSIVAIVAPILYRYLLNQSALTTNAKTAAAIKVSNAQNKEYDPSTQAAKIKKALIGLKFNSTSQKEKIIAAAKILPYHLGTQFIFENDFVELPLNHLSWTENDDAIEKILIENPLNYWIIEKLYHDVFTPSRNLTTDVLKYLDSSNLKRVRSSWKKYNKFI